MCRVEIGPITRARVWMIDCTASMVVYQNPPSLLRNAAESLLSSSRRARLLVVDNSPHPTAQSAFEGLPVRYHFSGRNAGYGKAHNWAISQSENSRYHLIMNPDIVIMPGTLDCLISFMESNPQVGMVGPRVLNEDGTDQYLNKRYPNVLDLFARRFVPRFFLPPFKKRLHHYEMKDIGYHVMCDVEAMSGAFMLCRKEVLKAVSGFDPRYFLYFEDYDLCRKFQQQGCRTVYNPEGRIVHVWNRESYRDVRLTVTHIVSLCRYFNKWGWKLYSGLMVGLDISIILMR